MKEEGKTASGKAPSNKEVQAMPREVHCTDELLTIIQVRQILKTGHTLTFALMKEGKLKSVKLGGKRLIPKSSLDAFVQSLKASAT